MLLCCGISIGNVGGIYMKDEKTLLITEDVIEDCLSECLEK